MRCRWKWNTVCQAPAPEQLSKFTPSATNAMTAAFAIRWAARVVAVRSSAGMSSRSVLWRLGTTNRCPSEPGSMSMKATVLSSSATITHGTVPATMPQNKQSRLMVAEGSHHSVMSSPPTTRVRKRFLPASHTSIVLRDMYCFRVIVLVQRTFRHPVDRPTGGRRRGKLANRPVKRAGHQVQDRRVRAGLLRYAR